MQNLKWTDKIDKESDIEAKDVNSLANAIITIIDWINSNGNNGNVDLSEYVKKEDGYGLSEIRYVSELQYYDTVTNTSGFGGIGYETQNGEYHEIHLYNQEQMDEKLSQKATMSDVEAYIEETLLGGAW